MSISLDQMRPKLHTLEEVTRILAKTEPTVPRRFMVGDLDLKFRAAQGWQHGVKAVSGNEPVGVYVSLRDETYQLTRSTLEETCLAFGLPRAYTTSCPADLLVPAMNHWFRDGMSERPARDQNWQYLVNGETAVAFTRSSLTPFSNLALLEQAVAAIRDRLGPDTEILADYKLSHTLRQTYLRLIIPETGQVITGTGDPFDQWSRGVSIKNSLTGTSQTAIEGYLFRWVCTNGQIDTSATSGTWTRRKDATEDEVYAWARTAVDDALSGLDGALDAVQDLTQIGIEGSVADTIRDVFEHYKIGIHQRPKIIQLLEDHDGEITLYVIMNAITQVANEAGLEPATVDSLMRAGGDLPRSGTDRCGACHRLNHQH